MKKLFAVLVGVMVLAVGGYAETILVPSQQPTIQAGIYAASDGDTVLVADGIYTGTGNKNIDFTGKAIVVISENGAENCIIDCEDDGRGFYFHSGEDSNSVLSGLKIINGYATGFSPEDKNGGGIYCYESSPTIENCTLTENSASDNGGGICCHHDSSPAIENCSFSGNSAGHDGGVIHCKNNSSPTIENCTLSGNSADWGGGIYCLENSNPTIENCAISGNSAIGELAKGGGIFCYQSNPTIKSCTLSGNSALFNGGAIFCWDSSPTIENCTLSENSVIENGGGIYCEDSSPTIENCTISGNSADHGGGIYCYLNSSPTGVNNIIWANTAPQGSQIYLETGCSFSCTYSDIQDGWPGTGNIDADPLFTPGPDGDYYLSQPEGGQIPPHSPCVDAGDALVPPNWGTTCTNQGYDIGIIDMGYHYPHLEGVPLPVEMTLFTATGGDSKVIIRWVTASEWNNSHFNLYRSYAENGGFQNIAQIEGHGTTSEENEYRYEDCQVVNGITYFYRISDVDINGVEEFYDATVSATPGGGGLGIVADGYELKQNSPNQFNAGTRIDYTVFEPGLVRLVVYDVLGKEIAVLVNEMQENNGYSVVFNAENLSSGIYFYALGVNGYKEVKKMVLVR